MKEGLINAQNNVHHYTIFRAYCFTQGTSYNAPVKKKMNESKINDLIGALDFVHTSPFNSIWSCTIFRRVSRY